IRQHARVVGVADAIGGNLDLSLEVLGPRQRPRLWRLVGMQRLDAGLWPALGWLDRPMLAGERLGGRTAAHGVTPSVSGKVALEPCHHVLISLYGAMTGQAFTCVRNARIVFSWGASCAGTAKANALRSTKIGLPSGIRNSRICTVCGTLTL